MKEHQLVGGSVPYGETRLDIAEVVPIVRAAEQFLEASPPKRYIHNDLEQSYTYSYHFKPTYDDSPDEFFTLKLEQSNFPEYTRVGISRQIFNGTDRHSGKLVRFTIETALDELVEAKKRVFLTLASSQVEVTESGPVEKVKTVRKSYERQMTDEDCLVVFGLIKRIPNRLSVIQTQKSA